MTPTNVEIAMRLRLEAEICCDEELAAWLRLAAERLDQDVHLRCRDCERLAECRGLCRPCYQRERRRSA